MSLSAKKSLGQHWLTDERILNEICDAAGVNKDDIVLEVGPGHGTLTKALLDNGALVTAVEFDQDLAHSLKSKVNHPNLEVLNQDILEFNLSDLPKGYKVVANIPYYLTSNLIRTLSEAMNPPSDITLLVQKEVAERICAEPGAMSLLSVSSQAYHDCSLGLVVPSDKFDPPPKVDSQVVVLRRKPQPQFGNLEPKKFFRVVKAGFSNRRKTLLNSLSAGLQSSKQETTDYLQAVDINPNSRAQELSIDDWVKLAKYLTR